MNVHVSARLFAAGLRQIAPEAAFANVGPDENLRETLDLDSVDFLHLLVGLHRELGVEIPEADYGKLTTKARLVEYLRQTPHAQVDSTGRKDQ